MSLIAWFRNITTGPVTDGIAHLPIFSRAVGHRHWSRAFTSYVEDREWIYWLGQTQENKIGSDVFQCDVPRRLIAQRRVGSVYVYCGRVGDMSCVCGMVPNCFKIPLLQAGTVAILIQMYKEALRPNKQTYFYISPLFSRCARRWMPSTPSLMIRRRRWFCAETSTHLHTSRHTPCSVQVHSMRVRRSTAVRKSRFWPQKLKR